MADSIVPGLNSALVQQKIASSGITPLLTKTYAINDEITESFYDGLGHEVGNQIPIVFGRVLLRGQVTDSGVIRSDLDPAKVQKVVQFVTTEGPARGIVGVPDDKLENVFINGNRVQNPDTGELSNPGFGLKEIGGIAASAAILAGVPFVKKLLGIDPSTGFDIADAIGGLFGGGDKPEDVLTAPTNDNDVMAFDKATNSWVGKSFVDVHKKSGIEVDDIVVQKDGQVVSSDAMIFNFIGGVAVTDAGNKQVNISITGGSGGPGGGGGGGSGDSSECSMNVPVPQMPYLGLTYTLRRNGTEQATFTVDKANTSLHGVAVGLADAFGQPRTYFTVSANAPSSPVPAVVVSKGTEPCLGCTQLGYWTITTPDNMVSENQAICDPIKPLYV